MSRARNIKPAFFKNDVLAELPFEYRILFQGLWCEADRAGKLEDRPRRIKAEVFPYDDVNVDAGLAMLHVRGFIQRYSVDGCHYIKITSFLKHQNPHTKEALSTIPEPSLDEPGASPVQASEIPVQAGLIPDSPILIPDSPIEEAKASLSAEAPPTCPHQKIIALYHEHMPMNPRIKIWEGARQDHLQARWRSDPKRQELRYWERFFKHCATSPFLTGQIDGRGGRPFRPSLEWMVKRENFMKIIEGNYHDKGDS